MIGQKIARFLSVEVKSKTGKPSDAQLVWADLVNNCGGRAIIINNIDDLC
jgi:hypothetical protein